MKIENIDIKATLEKAQSLIRGDEQLSPAIKSMFEILILIITLLANRLNLNSSSSSKPPASDPNRKRQPVKKTGKKAGGQNGHTGVTRCTWKGLHSFKSYVWSSIVAANLLNLARAKIAV